MGEREHKVNCEEIVEVNTPKIGEILETEISLLVFKLSYLSQFMSDLDLNKFSLEI